MTSLNSVLLSGLSALRANQQALTVTSQNIANANTPGYARVEVTLGAATQGVEVTSVARAANAFLAAASYVSMASYGANTARAGLLSQAQASFGDPNSATSLFGTIDQVWTSLTQLSADPSLALARSQAVDDINTAFSEISRAATEIERLINTADQRIAESVAQAQSLLDRIAALNTEIKLTTGRGGDASAVENAQAALLDELSALMDINVTASAGGGVMVRTNAGALLIGQSAAKLSYTQSNNSLGAYGAITITDSGGSSTNLGPLLQSGELAGLLQARDEELPALSAALAELAAGLADALNAVHNDNSSVPPPSVMAGRQTGLLGSDALNFSGAAVVGIVDAQGNLTQRLTIDFDTRTITGEAPAVSAAFGDSIESFSDALNAALGAGTPPASASFIDGVLTLNAQGGGIAIQQDSGNPSDRAGRGFAHFFGLNDLVSSSTPLFFETGVSGADAHGLAAGGQISLEITDASGRVVGVRTLTIEGDLADPGATWNDLLAKLNDANAGVGAFGQYSLDPATGALAFSSTSGATVRITQDSTQRGATGVSASNLFGLSLAAKTARATAVRVDADISADPDKLALAKPDMSIALGGRLAESGDGRGASALAAAGNATRTFVIGGSSRNVSTTAFAALLGGYAGSMAANAEQSAARSESIALAAFQLRVEHEGVSIDDELMRMTMYQNAYAAAARIIQAATEMYDVLLSIGR